MERANVERLKQDEPILFSLRDVQIDHDIDVLIAYVREDGRSALPQGMDRSRTILLLVNEETLEGIFRRVIDHPVTKPFRGNIVLFAKETAEDLNDVINKLAGPKTVVERQGFMPGAFPSNN